MLRRHLSGCSCSRAASSWRLPAATATTSRHRLICRPRGRLASPLRVATPAVVAAAGGAAPRAAEPGTLGEPQSLLVELLSQHGARLTTAAQMAWQQVIQPGDTVVDATCGNGHDTLFLAQAVGPTGSVHAMDIQEAAVQRTLEHLEQHVTAEQRPAVQVVQACHSQMQQLVGSNTARVIAFNLGYLPKGDKQVITKPGTTLAAVEAAFEVVRPGGLISIMAYTGHPGGLEEYQGVRQLLQELAPSYWVTSETSLLNRNTAPILLLVWRRPDVGPPPLVTS